MLAVQTRFLSFLHTPHFLAHWIVNDADDDFAFEAERDRNTEVRNFIKIIYRAVERIDHPLMVARLVADNSLFAIERVLGKLFEQLPGDEVLGLNVDREFDVVRERHIHVLRTMKALSKQVAGGASSVLGGVEIMLHEEVGWLRG